MTTNQDFCSAAMAIEPSAPSTPPSGSLLTTGNLAWLPARAGNSHKGDFGAVGVLGGASGMTGAVLLAATAALLSGAGRVWASFLDSTISPGLVAMQRPELMTAQPEILLANPLLSVLALGPGMGTGPDAHTWLTQGLHFKGPVILDADALNLVAQHGDLEALTSTRNYPTILTPHPGEAGRLLANQLTANRTETALALARRYRCLVVLKGQASVIATPAGDWWINSSGNPGLSAPGMGDVLTGVIAALIAQGLPPLNALMLGVFVHGAAADVLVNQGMGPAGLTASEVAIGIRALLNRTTA